MARPAVPHTVASTSRADTTYLAVLRRTHTARSATVLVLH